MPLDYLISAAVTLFVVVDPIGLVPTFLAVTTGFPAAARRNVAVRAAVIAGAILTGSALIGDWLLRQLGITLPAFRIAGGLLLFSIASEMVLGVRTGRQSRDAEQAIEEHVRNVAVFPLAMPLLAGPGAITATVLLAGQAEARPLYVLILVGVIAAVAATGRAPGVARGPVRHRWTARGAGGWIVALMERTSIREGPSFDTGPGLALVPGQNGTSSFMSSRGPPPAMAGWRAGAGALLRPLPNEPYEP